MPINQEEFERKEAELKRKKAEEKAKVLDFLEKNRGTFFTYKEIAEGSGVPYNGVIKTVLDLWLRSVGMLQRLKDEKDVEYFGVSKS